MGLSPEFTRLQGVCHYGFGGCSVYAKGAYAYEVPYETRHVPFTATSWNHIDFTLRFKPRASASFRPETNRKITSSEGLRYEMIPTVLIDVVRLASYGTVFVIQVRFGFPSLL